MFPTLFAGLVLLFAAVQYARQPDRRRMRIVRSLGVLTGLVGTLGFITGLIKTFMGAANAPLNDLSATVVGGVGESLNNIGLALCQLIIAAIVTTVGTMRAGKSYDRSELVDPRTP